MPSRTTPFQVACMRHARLNYRAAFDAGRPRCLRIRPRRPGASEPIRMLGGAFERFRASAVKYCEMRVLKANLLPLLFGCVGFILGFVICRALFVTSTSLEQVPTILPSVRQEQIPASVPAPRDQYACTIVSPTFPPQVRGVWEPLKRAAEEMAHLRTERAPDGLR